MRGFDTDPTKPLTGGIQTTGSYPGRARTPQELMADIEEVLKLCPGTKKLNLHTSYAIFTDGEWVDRDQLEPKHFAPWVEFCKKHGLGADFNPTFFSHPKCDPLTLSSPNEETRRFWVNHGKACVRISQYLAEELGGVVTMNIWTGDGFKDIPADRLGSRLRYKRSIDEMLSEPFDFNKVKPCMERKVFGIGVESYTVGSAEFALSHAAMNQDKCIPLMDNGHYHPTEVVSDKIPALLTFFPEIALHITRPVRWDSDHVVLFDDETKELCKEIVRCGGLDGRVHLALDYPGTNGQKSYNLLHINAMYDLLQHIYVDAIIQKSRKRGCTLRHQETADEQLMKTAYFLTATFPRKPPHFFASGHNTISKFTCTSDRVLAHSHLEPGNARRGNP